MAREDLHFRLRIPEALKRRIEAAADTNHRSMTAEIIARLEASFEADDIRLTGGLGRAELLHKLDRLPPNVQDTVFRVVEAILNPRPPSN